MQDMLRLSGRTVFGQLALLKGLLVLLLLMKLINLFA